MKKLKYVKLFESFTVNEGIFDIFKSKEKIESEKAENIRAMFFKDLMNPDKFYTVKLGSPEYKSLDDIKEGDCFLSEECVELLEMGKKDIALREWCVVQVEVIMRDKIKFNHIYLGGNLFIHSFHSPGNADTISSRKYHFSNKIVMK
jgi:hypothetical protein